MKSNSKINNRIRELISAKEFKKSLKFIESNKDKLILSCNRLLSDSKMKIFFDNSWEVKNEKEILTPDGDIYIPDRLLVSNEKTIILDYKTGALDEDHKNQITRYSNILSQMGYKNIEKFLIYTSTEKLVYQV